MINVFMIYCIQMKNKPEIPSFLILFLAVALSVGSCCPHKFEPVCNPEAPPPFCVPERIRVALVLGSGGVRGMAHVGVLEELEDAGIPVDLIVGCSAGSIVGALYADNPNVEEIKHAVWRIPTNSLFDLDLMHSRFGLSQGRNMRRILNEYLYAQTFDDLQIPLVIVATDLNTGELVPMGSGDLVKAVQSSCSIPFVFVPCEHMGRVMIDGGVVNPVPVMVARDLGAEVIIAVDLCELLPKTFPTNLFGVAARSAEIAFMWQNEACTHHADVIIRPKTCGIGTFNDAKKMDIYLAGKRAAREMIPEINALLDNVSKEKCETWRVVNLSCYLPGIER